MTISNNRDVVISSGHKNFHMLFTAAEMENRGRLSRIICGAYPTPLEQMILKQWPLRNIRKFNRFANRLEALPPERVCQNRSSEILSSLSRKLGRFGIDKDKTAVAAFDMYGKKSEGVLRDAVADGAKIYHYRAGFGRTSVAVAKKLGMKTICDHSIVHPALLEPLIALKGSFPTERPTLPGGIWGAVMEDIEAADLVVVNSDFVAETFKYMGFDESKLAVVYQGVEDKFFKCLPPERNYYSKDVKRPIRFLFAGGIVPRKGIDELSEIISELQSDQIEFHLAGSLSEDSRTRYAKLFEDTRVTYHGMLSQKEIAQLMSNVDVFIFPSRAEGSARVIFESMAAGCAVICTPNSGSAVQDGLGGTLIPVNDKIALAEAIGDVIKNPLKYSEYGRVNKQLIVKHYTQMAYGDSMEEVYAL